MAKRVQVINNFNVNIYIFLSVPCLGVCMISYIKFCLNLLNKHVTSGFKNPEMKHIDNSTKTHHDP